MDYEVVPGIDNFQWEHTRGVMALGVQCHLYGWKKSHSMTELDEVVEKVFTGHTHPAIVRDAGLREAIIAHREGFVRHMKRRAIRCAYERPVLAGVGCLTPYDKLLKVYDVEDVDLKFRASFKGHLTEHRYIVRKGEKSYTFSCYVPEDKFYYRHREFENDYAKFVIRFRQKVKQARRFLNNH